MNLVKELNALKCANSWKILKGRKIVLPASKVS